MNAYINREHILRHIQGQYVKHGNAYDAHQILGDIEDCSETLDIDAIIDEIEREADYYDAYIDADIAKGLYMALEIINKHKQ